MLTGVVALPLLILLILKGSLFLFSAFVTLITCLGLGEFYRMALPDRKLIGYGAALVGSFLPLLFLIPDKQWLLPVLTAMFLLSAIIFLFAINEIKTVAAEIALLVMGFLYIPLLLGHLLLLRGRSDGIQWIFLLLVIVMSGDTGAFYTGSNIGRRKLYPRVSPNKSVEGAIGGLLGSTAGALIARATFFPALSVADCIVTAMLLGTLGQLGDLFESLLKRSFGVKDSGVIIPGHGGILDRLDSILFAAPVAYYYAQFIFLPK